MRNYIFPGKVNFEGSLNDWELGGERRDREIERGEVMGGQWWAGIV